MKNICIVMLLLACAFSSSAQTEQEVKAAVLHSDSLFWTAYNNCDLPGMQKFIADDLEFYHDKGGIQKGIDQFSATTKNNLCGNSNFRLRREAVPGTVNVYVMTNDGVPYGAVLTGEHVFYVNETGKKERLDGLAKFNDFWLLYDSAWKMSRIFSYDHGPAPYVNKRNEISLPDSELQKFAGNYNGQQTGAMTVTAGRNLLRLTIGDKVYMLHPETSNRFFMIERNLEFEFINNDAGKVEKMIVWENGQVAETVVRGGER